MNPFHIGVIASSINSASFLLDEAPGAFTALSFRRLNSAYNGNCIQVRRSSDNTLATFGFVDDYLDTTALLAFVGGGNGYVRTWYDQSGYALDFNSTTNANQPLIISAGTLITQGGLASLYSMSASTILSSSAHTMYSAGTLDIYQIMSVENYNSSSYTLFSRAASPVWRVIGNSVIVQGSSVRVTAVYINDAELKYLNTYIDSSNFKYVVINDAPTFLNTNTTFTVLSNTSNPYHIFRSSLGNTSFSGYIQEVVVYRVNQAANKATIKSNLTSYYDTPANAVPIVPYYEPFGESGGSSPDMFFPKRWVDPAALSTSDFSSSFYIKNPDDIIPPCDVPGSSGGAFLKFINLTETGELPLSMTVVSTLGKTNITVNANQYREAGALPVTLTWDTGVDAGFIPFANVSDNSTWAAISPITLPSACENTDLLFLTLNFTSNPATPPMVNGFEGDFDDSLWYKTDDGTANSLFSVNSTTLSIIAGDDSSSIPGYTFAKLDNVNSACTVSFNWSVTASDTTSIASYALIYFNDTVGAMALDGLIEGGDNTQTGTMSIGLESTDWFNFVLGTLNDGVYTSTMDITDFTVTYPDVAGPTTALDDISITGT